MADEKRAAPRVHRRFVLRAALFGEEPLRWSHVSIHNLSSSGVLFTFDKELRLGAILHFKIDFPDRVVQCVGRVSRIGEPREHFRDVAARFEGLQADDRRYIEDFVRAHLPG